MLSDHLKVAWKYVTSFLKKEWDVEDYPLRMRRFQVDRTKEYGRLKPVEWSAQVINWPVMQGHGDTAGEAIADLRKRLMERKAQGKDLARPGTGLPIEFAPTYRIEEHPDLARDFFRRIVNLNYEECFISNESSLWDFHGEETNDHLNEKILLTYGVDVSDIESGNLADIFARLVSRGASA
jgi:hypothetical protein